MRPELIPLRAALATVAPRLEITIPYSSARKKIQSRIEWLEKRISWLEREIMRNEGQTNLFEEA